MKLYGIACIARGVGNRLVGSEAGSAVLRMKSVAACAFENTDTAIRVSSRIASIQLGSIGIWGVSRSGGLNGGGGVVVGEAWVRVCHVGTPGASN